MVIFVFSYFRVFVLDSISSRHNSLQDKCRGVEVDFRAESGSKSWPMGVPPDGSRKHESTKTRRNQGPGLYVLLAVGGQRETPLFGNGPAASPASPAAEVRALTRAGPLDK